MKIYVVHAIDLDAYEDSLVCGVYSTRNEAEAAIEASKIEDANNAAFNKRYRTPVTTVEARDEAYNRWRKRRWSEFEINELDLNGPIY